MLLAAVLAAAASIPAVALDAGSALVKVYAGTADISGFDFIPGTSELAVIEQRTGRVLSVDPATGTGRPLLDVSAHIKKNTPAEQGLVGIAISPDYQQSGVIYLAYTDLYNRWTLSRFRNGAEEVLLRADRYAAYHACGTLLFGPLDHELYACIGDSDIQGSPDGNPFNLEVLPGKLLRLDVLGRQNGYGIPSDNPYPSTVGIRPEIWASGLRNPWMFTFDSETGDAYVADVGLDTAEEVDFLAHGTGGQSFGWPRLEGPTARAGYKDCDATACSNGDQVAPIYWYGHGDKACAIIGGAVYRAPESAWNGYYLFGDVCSSELKVLRRTGDRVETAVAARMAAPPVGIRRAPDGTIYVADATGAISRLNTDVTRSDLEWVAFRPPVPFTLENQAGLVDLIRGSAGKTVVLSVMDEAEDRLTDETRKAFVDLGLTKIGSMAYRDSYVAVLNDGKVVKEILSHTAPITFKSKELAALGIDEVDSAGYLLGNYSHIVMQGIDISPGQRGFNVAVIGPDGVAVSSLDTNQIK